MSDASDDLVDELIGLLDGLGVEVESRPDGDLNVFAGPGVPLLQVDPNEVLAVEEITTPWGARAVMLVHGPPDWPVPVPVMILAGDLAFAPVPDAAQDRVLGEGRLRHTVGDLPPVLGFGELRRLLDAGASEASGDRLLGVVLAAAAGIEGARRAGVDVEALDGEIDVLIDRVRSD